MKTHFCQFLRIAIALVINLTGLSEALVIRHDTPTLSYENYGKEAQFRPSTGISRASDPEYGIAGATAIDSRWGVHARHTLKNVETWMNAGNGAKLRGTKWNGYNNQGLAAVNVNRIIHFDDDFTRFANAIDIALARTNAASSTLAIAPIFGGWDEVGRVGSGASAANNRQDGNGNGRKDEAEATTNSGRWYEVRWAGKNDINQVNTQSLGSPNNALLKVDFDHPTNTSKSVMGGTTAIDLEYGSMNGDSGSPIYVTKDGLVGQIAGVLSGGSGNVYGSTVVYVRTRPYKTWITDTLLANPDNRAVYIATIPDQIINLGDTLTVTETSTGTEQLPLTPRFSLINPPSGMNIDSDTGVITWTPTAAQAGVVHTIMVKVTEDGVVANSKTKSFNVTVTGSNLTEFWNWSAAPPNWSAVSIAGGAPYGLASSVFPHIQGDANTMIYQQITGTIPAWATVNVSMKAADFNQAWSNGGPIEFGFRNGMPTVANAGDAFLHSSAVNVPNYDGASLVDGLGNTGANVDYFFTFNTTTDLTNSWFAIRKNANGDRLAIDDIVISYDFIDTDEDGLPDTQEDSLGTNSSLADTDGDGLNDGTEEGLGTNPLVKDSDLDGYSDGFEVNVLSTSPLDADDPGGPNRLAIGINFVSAAGHGIGVGLSPPAHAGAPGVSQKNWNQSSVLPQDATSGSTTNIESPSAGVLVDSQGMATGATVSFTMKNMWSSENEELTPYGKLMAGYLDTNAAGNASVTVSSIPYPEYDVYVYFGANASGQSGSITDGLASYSFSVASKNVSGPGTYVRTTDTGGGNPSANYAVFEGKTSSSVTVTYLRGSANGGIYGIQIVPVGAASAYQVWAEGYGLDLEADGGFSEDADGDGSDNLLEFVLNSNPTNPASRPSLLVDNSGGSFSLTYERSRVAEDYNLAVKWSEDLSGWDDVGVSTSVVNDEEPNFRLMKASVSTLGRPKLYLRIEVDTP